MEYKQAFLCLHVTAIVIGGYGGGISLEVVERTQHCLGEDATPALPLAPAGNLEVRTTVLVVGLFF